MEPSCWWGIGIMWVILTVACVAYVWNDCHRGNQPGVIWSILTVVLGIFGMIIYLIYKAFLPDRGWRG